MTGRYGAVLFFAAWLLPVLVACMATSDAPVSKTSLPVEVLAVGGQCFPAPGTWTAAWISSPKQLQATMSRCGSTRIGGVRKETPPVDFDRFGVLTLEMGERTTAGYGFDAGKVSVSVENGTATVKISYHQPPPGAVTAQMMTAPWILIRMPLGSYDNIRVVDQDGRLLTAAAPK